LVVVELKQGNFKPEYKGYGKPEVMKSAAKCSALCEASHNLGQMELYLRWLVQNEREPEENLPLGIILCAGKIPSRSNCWNSMLPASMWPNI